MLKEKVLAGAVFCLSISIIISAVVISKGMEKSGWSIHNGFSNIPSQVISTPSSSSNPNTSSTDFVRYDLPAAASYLGVTQDNLKLLVNNKESGIPYIKIGEEYIFSKSALDKWLDTARVTIK